MTQNKSEEFDRNTLPWYKHPWVWLLISLPSFVVLACFFTLYLAISNAPEIEPMSIDIKKQLIDE